jgi:hypothetical protein
LFWGCKLHTSIEHLLRLFVAIFFASKAGKKGFPLLSASRWTVELFSAFIEAELGAKIFANVLEERNEAGNNLVNGYFETILLINYP